MTAAAGIARMRRHFQSIGRYSVGAFLYPIYGVGELPQAFARLCAVHGGIYILRYQPLCVVSERTAAGERRVKGILSDGRQLITADVLVCDREYVDDVLDHAAPASVSCAVCVVDGRVLSGASEALDELIHCVFPPLSVHDNQQPVRLVQLSGSVKAAPEGQYVLYLTTPSTAASVSAMHDLQPIVEYVTQRPSEHSVQAVSDVAISRKPHLLSAFYYKRKQRAAVMPAADSSDAGGAQPIADCVLSEPLSSSLSSSFGGCSNVFVTADSSPLLSLDSHIEAAQRMLDRLAPGVALVTALTTQRVHEGDEEKQQLEQLNILNSVIDSHSAGDDLHDDDDDDAVSPAASESKEQVSARPSSILPLTAEQQQRQQQQPRREVHGPTATGPGGGLTAASDADAVLDSLDELTFN